MAGPSDDPSIFVNSRSNAGNPLSSRSTIPGHNALSVCEIYEQEFLRELTTIQKAHPELTPYQCRRILDSKLSGILDNVLVKASESQIPNLSVALDPRTDNGENVSSLPLVRTESCPLPQRNVGGVQLTRRQLSALSSSTLGANSAFARQLQFENQGEYLFQQPTYPDFSRISATNFTTAGIPPPEVGGGLVSHSSIAGFVNRDPREDPYSSFRGWIDPPQQDVAAFSAPARLSTNQWGQLEAGSYTSMHHMIVDPQIVLGTCMSSPQAPQMESMPSQSSYVDTMSITTEPHGEQMMFEFDEVDMATGALMQQSATQGLTSLPLPATTFPHSDAQVNEEFNPGVFGTASSNAHTQATAVHGFDLLNFQSDRHSVKPSVGPYELSALETEEPQMLAEMASEVSNTVSRMSRQSSTSSSVTAMSDIGHMQRNLPAAAHYPRIMPEGLNLLGKVGGGTGVPMELATAAVATDASSLARKRNRGVVESAGLDAFSSDGGRWVDGPTVTQGAVNQAKKRRQELEGNWSTIGGANGKPGITSNAKTSIPSSQPTMRPILTRVGEKSTGGSVAPYGSRRYVRRRDCRVYCKHCNEFPKGFRGEHERRRHYDRAHSAKRKVWVTVDISPNKDFFGNCKPCREGRRYGADYNATAHLKRQHFCKEARGGKGRKESEAEKKSNIDKVKDKLREWGIQWWFDDVEAGGRGSKTDPEVFSLRFLRSWLKEIEIDGDEPTTAATETSEAEREESQGKLGEDTFALTSTPLPIPSSKGTAMVGQHSSLSPTGNLAGALSFLDPSFYPHQATPFDDRLPHSSLGYHQTMLHQGHIAPMGFENESPLLSRVGRPTGFLGGEG